MEENKQGSFSGWAVIEMMGHRKEIGFVTTEAFGQAVLFRVDTPELPERSYQLTEPTYAEAEESPGLRIWCHEGTMVRRKAIPARSCLISPASLYAINPCTEEAARTAIEATFPRPLIAFSVPSNQLSLAESEGAAADFIDGAADDINF